MMRKFEGLLSDYFLSIFIMGLLCEYFFFQKGALHIISKNDHLCFDFLQCLLSMKKSFISFAIP